MTNVITDPKIIESMQEETIRKRGRPRKEQMESENVEQSQPEVKIKKADVVQDYTRIDPWLVRNKDPKLEYKWGRIDNDMEMMEFAAKQYIPATGDEVIVGNPFESIKCGSGERKIRGNRILMCCPKSIVNARREQEARKYKKRSDLANDEARKSAARSNLGMLEIEETKNVSRESILEPAKTEE